MTLDGVIVDSEREILANKLCAIVGRNVVRDLVDLKALLEHGADLESAIRDAQIKDGSVNAASISWVIDQMAIGEAAPIPSGISPAELDAFRRDLIRRLQLIAFPNAPK
jgi:hypothetical protein